MSFVRSLDAALSGRPLSAEQMEDALEALFSGDTGREQAAAFLTALRVRGETAEEVLAAVRFLKNRARLIASPEGTIDTCGTGGDGAQTLNISTATALVVAGAGVPVAKHGNRAVSSASGSSDVLAELGVDLSESLETQEARLREDGIAFLFAPNHHPVLAQVAPVRKALGFRTLFNMLGPLMNPAGTKRQLVGVFAPDLGPLFAEVLAEEGAEKIWVVHGAGGLDELSLAGENRVTELADGASRNFSVSPGDAGLEERPISELRGGGPRENAEALAALLRGERGAFRDAVLFNAAACLLIADRAKDLREGVAFAAKAIDEGAAEAKLDVMKRRRQG